jgi:hypothetical protein
MQVMRLTIWVVLALALSRPVIGEELPKEPGPARTVKMFDLFCLSLLPEISRIAEAAAAGNFTELKGKRLEKYQPQVGAEEVRAWSYDDFGSEFVLTTARSKPDAQFKKDVPEFADSINFACSLLFPAKDPKENVLKEMVGLLEREPDEAWDQGPARIYEWTGQTDSLHTQVLYIGHHAPAKKGSTALLSTSAFVKN